MVKTKTESVLGAKSDVCRIYREKLVWGVGGRRLSEILSAQFLKKFRKVVTEQLHPCSHVLEYSHRLLSFSDILSKLYTRWIEFYGDDI